MLVASIFLFSCRTTKLWITNWVCDRTYDSNGVDQQPEIYGDKFAYHLEYFTQFDWMRNQSFCWNGKSELSMSQTLNMYGNCFTFNADEDMFKHKM